MLKGNDVFIQACTLSYCCNTSLVKAAAILKSTTTTTTISAVDEIKPVNGTGQLTQDVYNTVWGVPHGIRRWIEAMWAHVVSDGSSSIRPRWDMKTALFITALQTMRDQSLTCSLQFWRMGLNQLRWICTPPSDAIIVPFAIPVQSRDLPGILKDVDRQENGARIIEAEWIKAPTRSTTTDQQHQHQNKQYPYKRFWHRYLPYIRPELLSTPCSAASIAKEEKVVLFIHGGGYVAMSCETHRYLTYKISKATGRNVVAFNYRLAPEVKFPGALYDTVQAYLYLIDDLHMDPMHITIMGDSAGGGLCMALSLYLRDHGAPLPEAMVLLSPWVDLTFEFPTWANAEAHDCLPPKPACWDKNPAMLYLGKENHEKLCRHPYVSPIYASNFNDLPTTLIQSGGCEALRDEIVELVRKLKDSRMSTIVQHEQYEHMPHVFQLFPLSQSQKAIDSIGRFVRSL